MSFDRWGEHTGKSRIGKIGRLPRHGALSAPHAGPPALGQEVLLPFANGTGAAAIIEGMEPQKTPTTQMDVGEERTNGLSGQIIGCALTAVHTLGCGFLEKVYQNALVPELRKTGLVVAQQHRVAVRYESVVVGDYTVDLLVEQLVLVELKVAKAIDDVHRAQCLSYLQASDLQLCLLLNFGKPRPEIKRLVRDL